MAIGATLGGDSKALPARPAQAGAKRGFEHLFFTGMALLILGAVFGGFARQYYLAGVFHAPLPDALIHIHAAVFSCWILLLVAQTSLVSAGRVDLHRILGIGGFVLACAMVLLGILAATDGLARGHSPVAGLDPRTFYAVPMLNMVLFAPLILFAYRARSRPAVHKRLILIATIGLTNAAFDRWPILHHNLVAGMLLSDALLLMLVVYDLWSTHTIQRATLWGGTFLILMHHLALPIGGTAPWLAFATWAQHVGRSFL
ncbi:MAG: hypothetical protein WBF06_07425 [Candidatus Acidiferrales bacterium]